MREFPKVMSLVKMKGIKLIIFDLDGTLINAYPAIIRSFNYTMQKMGYSRKDNLTIRRAVGWGDENLLKPFIKRSDLKKAILLYRRHHQTTLIKDSRLFPGVEMILRYFKNEGYKLAIASNRPTKFSRILIHHLKIAEYFDYLLCADRLRYGKPHPAILNKIMRRFSLGRRETLYIGDMVIDIQAARAARIKSVIVTTGSSTKQEIRKQGPSCIIARITELPRILQ